jgi:hypothetical protein
VNRPSFFSRNLRHIVPFVFCPIEPPRTPSQNTQIYVRKKHTLPASNPPSSSDGGFWGGLFRNKPPAPQTGNGGTIAFEARLPNPAIIVPTEPIPLTFLLKRDTGSTGIVYIRTIQVMLGITTYIAAQGFRRELGYLLPILNCPGLNLTLPEGKSEITINPADLLPQGHGQKTFSLPDTIPPSFRTCNIARKYTLVLQMGVSSSPSTSPEIIQLTIDIQVFSGFKPPPELLSTAHPPGPPPATTQDGKTELTGGELPTYDEAVADGLATLAAAAAEGDALEEERRGHFEFEAEHLQGAESWDADEKK